MKTNKSISDQSAGGHLENDSINKQILGNRNTSFTVLIHTSLGDPKGTGT